MNPTLKRRIVLLAALAVSVVGVSAWAASQASQSLGDETPRGTNPLIAAALPAQSVFSTDAVVLERVPAGSYLYLRVAAQGRERWAATLASFEPRGTSLVRLTVFGRAHHFHSARLDRDFDELWFAGVSPRAVPPAVQEGAVR